MSECPGCVRLRTWNKTAWKQGYDNALRFSKRTLDAYEKAFAKEKEDHHDTNSKLTEIILSLEDEIERLKLQLTNVSV